MVTYRSLVQVSGDAKERLFLQIAKNHGIQVQEKEDRPGLYGMAKVGNGKVEIAYVPNGDVQARISGNDEDLERSVRRSLGTKTFTEPVDEEDSLF